MPTKLSSQVATFMAMVNQDLPSKPTIPADNIVRLRLRLVLEEAFELVEACASNPYSISDIKELCCDTFNVINNMPIKVDLPEYADALADLDYVVDGGRAAFGINGEPIADAVHAANLAKLGGPVDPNGKARKPAGWTPPDIHGELVKQGWRP